MATLTQVRKDKTQKQMSMKDPIEKLTITCPKAYREFYQKTLGDHYAWDYKCHFSRSVHCVLLLSIIFLPSFFTFFQIK